MLGVGRRTTLPRQSGPRGFSLIELLIVVCIVLIVAALCMPRILQAINTLRVRDTLYGGYKAAPVFAYFDQNNTVIAVPPDLALGEAAVANARSPSVVINVLSQYPDSKNAAAPGRLHSGNCEAQ